MITDYSDDRLKSNIFLVTVFALFIIVFIGLKLSLSGPVGWGGLALADQIMSLIIIGIAYRYKRYLTTNTIGIGCLFLLMHEIGSLGVYGWSFGILRYDKVLHFFGGFVLVFIFYDLLSNFLTDGEHKWHIIPFAILCALGVGAFTEIIEYVVGFQIVGDGVGFFAYGEGDFGEWQDTIFDMASNFLGTILSAITALIMKRPNQ